MLLLTVDDFDELALKLPRLLIMCISYSPLCLCFKLHDDILNDCQDVANLQLGYCIAGQQLWASCSHPCVSVTKQYNLVPAKEW